MREIKFRAWDNVKKEMFFSIDTAGSLIDFFTHFREIHDGYGRAHLMQYTGLLDKNVKEIYEGDILRFEDFNCDIFWDDEYSRYALNYHMGERSVKNSFFCTKNSIRSEIIGNLYEHPELLKRHC